jgi:DNA-binding response OmpR family regulator
MHPQRSILIVDDEPNVRLVLQTALESAGYRVGQAEDGAAALKRLGEERYDLVVLDLQMPRMDGMEMLRRLRRAGSAVPVVFLSAHGSIPDAVEAMKLGAIDFLTKPITPEALRRVAAEVIDRNTTLPAQAPAVPPTASPSPRQVAFDLARAKRFLNRGEFQEAELLLGEIIALDPVSKEARELLDRLQVLKEQEAHGSFRILRDWFPGGKARGKP